MAKKREPFSTSIDGTLKKKLNDLAERTEINVSKLTDKAIELLLEYYDKNEQIPYRNQFNTRTINNSFTDNKEENQTGYEKVLDELVMQQNNSKSNIESDIMDMDLDEIENALNVIKSFKDNLYNSASIKNKKS